LLNLRHRQLENKETAPVRVDYVDTIVFAKAMHLPSGMRVIRLNQSALRACHCQDQVSATHMRFCQERRYVRSDIQAPIVHELQGNWIGALAYQCVRTGRRHVEPRHIACKQRRRYRTAANVAFANHQNVRGHRVTIAAVKPALIAGSNWLRTRLKRASPVLSTYTTSFGCKSN
jgi:sRNA-binding protein